MEPAHSSNSSDEQILEWYLGTLSAEGWRVVYRSAASAELEKPRRPNLIGLFGCVLLVAIGALFSWLPPVVVAVLGLLLLVVDYFRQQPASMRVTAEQARAAARRMEGGYME